MKKSKGYRLAVILGVVLVSGNVQAESVGQYNMSLQDKVITGPKGSLTSPLWRLDSNNVPDSPTANAIDAVCNFPHTFFFDHCGRLG